MSIDSGVPSGVADPGPLIAATPRPWRLPDLSRAIREAVPAAATEPLGVVTAAGGATVLLLLLSVLYWTTDRRRTAAVVSYALVALGIVIALKAGIGWPRPPESVRMIPLENDPYGFPSGHAVAAVTVYGGLASAWGRLDDRRVVAGVTAAVVLIAGSRVALGMHYLGDVVAGTLLGLAVLATCRRVVGRDPRRGFALATAAALPAVLVTGGRPEALLALGGSVGGLLASVAVVEVPPVESRVEAAVLVAVGLPLTVVGDELGEALEPSPAAAVAYACLVAAILLLPAAVDAVPLERVRGAGQ